MTVDGARHSPFLQCGQGSQADQLAIVYLKRDSYIPTVLRANDTAIDGYDEGKVINTRFGSFPHSTLVGIPWGSQVRASLVDTGSRGRRSRNSTEKSKKRKREPDTVSNEVDNREALSEAPNIHERARTPVEAPSGFVHLLPPTPEAWTTSLPHRTQVVYTPDYSYILHRIRARPGTRLIEAGAGSGSFTHAAARAVFSDGVDDGLIGDTSKRRKGKVWSFEFHEQRAGKLSQEISDHGLGNIVELTHRDVCEQGFLPESSPMTEVKATAVFLDLPAPWMALKHLRRSTDSPLDHCQTVHLCTFSPCIEQVQKTVSALRQLGWLEIEMVELAGKRIEVRRDRVGLQEAGLHGVSDSPATVEEAVTRLREIEGRPRVIPDQRGGEDASLQTPTPKVSKQERLKLVREAQEGRKLYKEGNIVTRAESELKTHTSYLVFAVLPRQWTDQDERDAQEALARFQRRQEVLRTHEPAGRVAKIEKVELSEKQIEQIPN